MNYFRNDNATVVFVQRGAFTNAKWCGLRVVHPDPRDHEWTMVGFPKTHLLEANGYSIIM
jgi:hypothetical protein